MVAPRVKQVQATAAGEVVVDGDELAVPAGQGVEVEGPSWRQRGTNAAVGLHGGAR